MEIEKMSLKILKEIYDRDIAGDNVRMSTFVSLNLVELSEKYDTDIEDIESCLEYLNLKKYISSANPDLLNVASITHLGVRQIEESQM